MAMGEELLAAHEYWLENPKEPLVEQKLAHWKKILDKNFCGLVQKLRGGHDLYQSSEKFKEFSLKLNPWRKGPYHWEQDFIDGEWDLRFKADRLAEILDAQDFSLEGKTLLDVGANNGYFMFWALQQKVRSVLGLEPVHDSHLQFELIKQKTENFTGNAFTPHSVFLSPLGIEDALHLKPMFDLILCMGVHYHRRNPIMDIQNLISRLRPGGLLVLEGLVVESEKVDMALCPKDRYAGMRNVWFLPSCSTLETWLERLKLIEVGSSEAIPTRLDEQRNTQWCPPPKHSLKDFIDPHNPTLTIEGYPAPKRAFIWGRKKGAQS